MADDGQVKISIDDSEVEKGIKTLDDYQKAFNKLNTNSFVDNTDTAGNAVKDLVNRLDVDVDMKNFNKSIKDAEEYLKGLALAGYSDSESFQKVAQSVQAAKLQVEQAKNTVKQATSTTQAATNATNELQDANKNVEFKNVSNGADNLSSSLKRLVGAYVGIRGVQLAFQKTMESVEAFRTQERAVASLETTLKNAGVYTAEYSRKIQALASEIQGYSNYGDEAIIKAQALGQSFAGQVPFTEKTTKAVIDFAAATGMDLDSAFTLVGKSIGSSTNALGRYGVELQKGMTESQKMDAITKQLSERYAGQTQQMANTSVQLKNAISDLAEAFGGKFDPAVEKSEKLLTRLANAMTNALNKNRILTAEISKLRNSAEYQERYDAINKDLEFYTNHPVIATLGNTRSEKLIDKLKREKRELEKLINEPIEQTTKPIKMTDEPLVSSSVGSGSSSAQKIKDDYEKLQASVQAARREIELAAIAHGTSSQEVQQAFVKYNELNTQLSAVGALFEKEKVKVDETKGSYEQLQQRIQSLKTELQNLGAQGGVGTAQFDQLKNEYISAMSEIQNVDNALTQEIGRNWDNVSKQISSALGSNLISALQGGQSALQAFSSVATSLLQKVLNKMLEMAVITPILNALTGGTGGTLFSTFSGLFSKHAKGDIFQHGNVIPFAKGGVVSKPTVFPMANGGTGLMGEAGAEAVMPLRRMSNGRLGVEASNGDNGKAVQVNIFNQSNSQVETRQRDDGSMDIIIKRVNEALMNERTSSGFRAAYQREDRKGLQAV